jgi:hypothetical protein
MVPQQLTDQSQVYTVRDCQRREMVAQIMEPQLADTGFRPDRIPLPVDDRHRPGEPRGWENIAGCTSDAAGVEDRTGRGVQPDHARAGLGVLQHGARPDDTVPFEPEDFAPPCARQDQQPNGITRVRHLILQPAECLPKAFYGGGGQQLAALAPLLLAQALAGIGAAGTQPVILRIEHQAGKRGQRHARRCALGRNVQMPACDLFSGDFSYFAGSEPWQDMRIG